MPWMSEELPHPGCPRSFLDNDEEGGLRRSAVVFEPRPWIPTSAESDRVDGLLDALDEVDGALRTLYRQLAGDPDLASEYEPRLKELHAKRLDLAQRVGLAILAQRRASDRVDEALSESMAAFAETVQNGGDPISSVVNTEPAAEAEEESPPSSAPASDAQLAQWKTVVPHERPWQRAAGGSVGNHGVGTRPP